MIVLFIILRMRESRCTVQGPYTVSNFNDVWGLSEQDYEIGEYQKGNWITGVGIIRVEIFECLLPFS